MYSTSHQQSVDEQKASDILLEGSKVLQLTAESIVADIVIVAGVIYDALNAGGKLLICGNGGSAADAQHFAAEYVGRFRRERPGWAALALTVDSSILTSLGNDYGFEQVFARQVQAYGRPGDVLVGISTSGSSKNVLAAVVVARELGMKTVGLTGAEPNRLGEQVDHLLAIPSPQTFLVQQVHMAVIHVICELVEDRLSSGARALK